MSENYFTDTPERWKAIETSNLKDFALDYESSFGDASTFESKDEALEFFKHALEEMGRLAGSDIQANAEEIDTNGVTFKDGLVTLPPALVSNLKQCAEIGVFATPISREYDGLNIPRAPLMLALEMFAQACPNTGLTIAAFSMGDFIEAFCSKKQKDEYLPKILSNEMQTSMALTEPNAGSDLGNLQTKAEKDGDVYRISGQKIFITNGNSDLVCTLARSNPESTGLEGLSVFLIPNIHDGKKNIDVTGIEDKVCLHSSPTCQLNFDHSVGYLMGEEGQGFKVMLELMNAARLAMSSLVIGIASRARNEAVKYAKERVSMGKPIIEHPMIADMIMEMDVEIRAMRSMIVSAANAGDQLRIAKHKNDIAGIKKWKKRYHRLTPLCKYMSSERTVIFCKNTMQIFGGYGVCKEFPAERLLRESTIYPIYEGTSQIQSLMVLKDTLKDVAQHASGFLGSLAGAWAESKVTRDPVKSVLLQARHELNRAISTILLSVIKQKFSSDIHSLKEKKIQEFLKDFSLNLLTQDSDLTVPFLSAERLTKITCDYYALKSMADSLQTNDDVEKGWILNFAEIAIPRMKAENLILEQRISTTTSYMHKHILE